MDHDHHTKDNVIIITPKINSLNATDAASFKAKVLGIVEKKEKPFVVIDLRNLNKIDSSGLGSILTVLGHLNTRGGGLKLSCMNRPVRTMFELVSMHKLFDICNTTEDAISDFQKKK
jgi:anti-anti-sigma factor